MSKLVFTLLGCGSSGGVPRLGGHWGACDPNNPKNHRRRCSLLVQRISPNGTTSVLIDTSPDLRAQLLDAGIGLLDAAIYTHDHADHVHGLDDLRMIAFNRQSRLPVYASAITAQTLHKRFDYIFKQPSGSLYPPILDMHIIDHNITISGAGGDITFQPFEVMHGSIAALGFRIDDLAYLPDVSAMPAKAWQAIAGLECWIVDALQRKPHPTHTHLDQTLAWIKRAAPRRAVLTNMHFDLDYQTLKDELPPSVAPGFDTMQLIYDQPCTG